jgi:hypothetical protein
MRKSLIVTLFIAGVAAAVGNFFLGYQKTGVVSFALYAATPMLFGLGACWLAWPTDQSKRPPAQVRGLPFGSEYEVLGQFKNGNDSFAILLSSAVASEPFVVRLDYYSRDIKSGRVIRTAGGLKAIS